MDRVEALLAELSPEEKAALVTGSGPWHTAPVPRLGIPALKLTDGPNATRGDSRSGERAACFPVGVALGASFDPELLEAVGAALGGEARSKGARALLGPTINLQRTPLGGRNFECYSEDPHLTGELAAAFVRGVQSRGVAACPKHFVCNDTEHDRHELSVEVAEAPLRELYLRPFERVVRGEDPWLVMSAYNRIHGVFASSHRELLTGVLKDEWGFSGVVVSDWGASRHPVENAQAGLDLAMPGPARGVAEQLLGALRSGALDAARLDDRVRRILRLLERTGRLDEPEEEPERTEDTPALRALARRAATSGMVLLRNAEPPGGVPLLPLDPRALARVAVIGPNARRAQIQGGGSSRVTPHREVHPLEALARRLPAGVAIRHEPGCRAERYAPAFEPATLRPRDGEGEGFTLEIFEAPGFGGAPVHAGVERSSRISWFGAFASVVRTRPFSARLSARYTPTTSGLHRFGLASAGRSRLRLDGETILEHWDECVPGETFYGFGTPERTSERVLEAGRELALEIEYEREAGRFIGGVQAGVAPPLAADALGDAEAAAREADLAIVVVGTDGDWETEGHDRASLGLPGAQDELVARVCAANPRTLVVVNSGSPVGMPWLERAAAVLQLWFPGQECGEALCDVLFGEVDPGGRLPLCFPRRIEDTPAYPFYPGARHRMEYGEGLFVGYRHYDARGVAPLLPFGHGLSYARFEYGPLEVAAPRRAGEPVVAAVEVENASARAGVEVVQLYAGPAERDAARPLRELRAFRKLELAPGERRRVELRLAPEAFAVFDPRARAFVPPRGPLELWVGRSSADLRSRARLELPAPPPATIR